MYAEDYLQEIPEQPEDVEEEKEENNFDDIQRHIDRLN
jgi:hypothetical protein